MRARRDRGHARLHRRPASRPRPRSAARARRPAAASSAGSARARIAAASSAALMAPGAADRQRADRHAARHLDDRVQAVDALERRALDRHAQHRQGGQRGDHARQVRRAAGAGDDHLQPAVAGTLGEGDTAARACGAPRRSAPRSATPQLVQHVGGVAHRRPVRLAAHDHAPPVPAAPVHARAPPGSPSSLGRRRAAAASFSLADLQEHLLAQHGHVGREAEARAAPSRPRTSTTRTSIALLMITASPARRFR